MSRKRPAPQDIAVGLNASVPLRVKDMLVEKADEAGLTTSAYLTKTLKDHFGMK